MRTSLPGLLLAATILVLPSGVAASNEVEGRVESVDAATETFIVQGISFRVTASTDFDDGLSGFHDLQPGQKVEIEFEYRDGRHIAREIELED